jgi:hypothetical protein
MATNPESGAFRRILFAAGPHVLALALFAVLSVLFYGKVYDGYQLKQPDIANWKGMYQEIADNRILTGEGTNWTGSLFGGMPTYQIGGSRSSVFNITSYLWTPVNTVFGSGEVASMWMGMVAAYLLALAFGVAPWMAMLAGAGFGLSSLNVLFSVAGHITKVSAIATMPGVLAGIVWALRRNVWWGGAMAAVFLGLHISANHLQMTYYLVFAVLAIVLVESVRLLLARSWGKLFLAGGILLAAAAVASFPNYLGLRATQDYAAFTTRGEAILTPEPGTAAPAAEGGLDRDYILTYSMSRGEWLASMSPNMFGGGEQWYWGDQEFSGGAFYFGAVLMALFLAFLIASKDPIKWAFAAVTVLAIALSWRDASGLTDFFLEKVPAFAKFRDTKMMLVLVQIAVAAGAALAIKEWSELAEAPDDAGMRRRRWMWMGSLGAIFVLFGLFYAAPESFFGFEPTVKEDRIVQMYAEQMEGDFDRAEEMAREERLALFTADVARTLGLLAVTLLVAAAILFRKIKWTIAFPVLAVIALGDMWNVDRRYCNEERSQGAFVHWDKVSKQAIPYAPTPQMLRILELERPATPAYEETVQKLTAGYKTTYPNIKGRDAEQLKVLAEFGALRMNTHFRVLNWDNPFNDAQTSYFLQSVGGYHGAKLRRYQDFIERVLMPERTILADSAQAGRTSGGLRAMVGHRMLNTKYILIGSVEAPVPMVEPSGAAWFADTLVLVEDADAEIAATAAVADLGTAVVHSEFAAQVEGLGNPGVTRDTLLEYAPERLVYEAESERGGLLVLSEIWYPEGWKAKVDGQDVDIVRANYLLRAIPLTAGKHTVELTFEPELDSAASAANAGTASFVVFVLGCMAMAWVQQRRKAA